MKNIYLLMSAAILALLLTAAGFLQAYAPNHKTSFIYKVTSTAIITKVTYDPDQAPQVEKYIDSCLQPVVVFGNSHKANKEVRIDSQTIYHIKGSPGSLNMRADKMSNAAPSLNKLKTIFDGLKSVIKPS